MKRLLLISEVADLLVVSDRTVRRLILSGDLTALKVRGGLRIEPESVKTYQQRQIARFQIENGILPADENFVSGVDRT